MADFLIAYNKTNKFEGLYSNDPADRGGETWKGIARKANPNWEGWKVIDKHRTDPTFPQCLGTIPELEVSVQKLYRKSYWNPVRGDEINNQEEANSIYDSSVNNGFVTAIKMAQKALGMFHQTGIMDNSTLIALNNQE